MSDGGSMSHKCRDCVCLCSLSTLLDGSRQLQTQAKGTMYLRENRYNVFMWLVCDTMCHDLYVIQCVMIYKCVRYCEKDMI